MTPAKENDFSRGEIWRVIMRMAVPMMLAELVNVLYSVVDRMYIGHMAGIGDLALTGLGITTPIVSLVTAFASLCGTGGGPLCSIYRGKGDTVQAEKIMGNTLTMILGIGLTLTVGLLLFMEPVLYAFGASQATFPYAYTYGMIYVCGTVFAMISLGMNYFINAQGFAKIGMLTVTVSAVVNIILDPIFIFVFKMGIAGAAIATVIAQGCSAVWVMRFLLGKRSLLKLRLANMRLEIATAAKILSLGLSGFVMKATTGLVQILYNVQLRRYGGDSFIGSMTIVNSIRDVLFMTFHGLTNGCQPVIGYNYGAKAYDRVRGAIRFTTLACGLYAFVCWVIVLLIPGPLTRIFNGEEELLRICIPAIRIFFSGFVFKACQMVGQCVFVALGRSGKAIFFSLLRKIIIVVPLLYLLPVIPGLGAFGVFWSEPAADFICSIACYTTMYFTVYKAMDREHSSGILS